MELLQLRTFLVAAKTLHFTRASEEIGISQSAVSHQIIALERELGVSLFLRVKKGMTLTSYGETVLRYADQIFDHVNAIPRDLNRISAEKKESIRITARLRSLGNPFHEIRREFLKVYPNAELYYQAADNLHEVINQVKTGKSEVGIAGKSIKFGGLREIPYGEFRMIPVISPEHRLAQREGKVQLSELADEEWVLFDKDARMRHFVDNAFSARQFKPAHIYESNDGAVLHKQVVLGKGIGFLPSWAITEEVDAGQLIELDLDIEIRIPIYFVVLESNRSPLVDAFLEFMKTKQIEGVALSRSVSR